MLPGLHAQLGLPQFRDVNEVDLLPEPGGRRVPRVLGATSAHRAPCICAFDLARGESVRGRQVGRRARHTHRADEGGLSVEVGGLAILREVEVL